MPCGHVQLASALPLNLQWVIASHPGSHILFCPAGGATVPLYAGQPPWGLAHEWTVSASQSFDGRGGGGGGPGGGRGPLWWPTTTSPQPDQIWAVCRRQTDSQPLSQGKRLAGSLSPPPADDIITRRQILWDEHSVDDGRHLHCVATFRVCTIHLVAPAGLVAACRGLECRPTRGDLSPAAPARWDRVARPF